MFLVVSRPEIEHSENKKKEEDSDEMFCLRIRGLLEASLSC